MNCKNALFMTFAFFFDFDKDTKNDSQYYYFLSQSKQLKTGPIQERTVLVSYKICNK